MQRVIPVPDDIPDSYVPVILVFAETEGRDNTQLCYHASEQLLKTLRLLPMAKRMRGIKQICSNVETMLLQYSSNPEDVREIAEIG